MPVETRLPEKHAYVVKQNVTCSTRNSRELPAVDTWLTGMLFIFYRLIRRRSSWFPIHQERIRSKHGKIAQISVLFTLDNSIRYERCSMKFHMKARVQISTNQSFVLSFVLL